MTILEPSINRKRYGYITPCIDTSFKAFLPLLRCFLLPALSIDSPPHGLTDSQTAEPPKRKMVKQRSFLYVAGEARNDCRVAYVGMRGAYEGFVVYTARV